MENVEFIVKKIKNGDAYGRSKVGLNCLYDKRLSFAAKGIYSMLCDFANEDGLFDVDEIEVNDKEFQSGMEELRKYGYISKV